MAYIGIDLGTTYTCAGVMKNGKVEILQSETGAHTVPSIVAFPRDKPEIIGAGAKLHVLEDPEYCVYNVKRLIGRKFNDPAVKATLENLPFDVIDEKGYPKIKVPDRKGRVTFLPEEISGMVLKKMKNLAEKYLGKTVTKAVITIPHHFDNKQREATRIAAEYAGLHLLRLVHEPTAVAIAYGLENKTPKTQNIVVYDLGGGTFDVSVLTIRDTVIYVKGTAGDRNLGGEDFDINMTNICTKEFAKQYGKDLGENEQAKYRLREACRKHKEELSLEIPTSVKLDKLFAGKNFSATFTRAQFEHMNKDHFDSTMAKVEQALEDANMKKQDVDVVVLAGGSSKIPYVRKIVEEYFGKNPEDGINPDEAVAYGATLLAAQMSGDVYKEVKNFELHDLTPLSLGIETKGEVMSFVIPRGTEIPTEKCERYTTSIDNQARMKISVYEGERADIQLNNLMANFTLCDIPPKPEGVPKIDVTFKLDINGILKVSARELETGNEKHVDIDWGCAERSKESVVKRVEEAERFEQEDNEWKENKVALNALESFARKVIRLANTEGVKSKMTEEEHEDILEDCNEILEWVGKNPEASVKETRKKKRYLQNIFRPYEE